MTNRIGKPNGKKLTDVPRIIRPREVRALKIDKVEMQCGEFEHQKIIAMRCINQGSGVSVAVVMPISLAMDMQNALRNAIRDATGIITPGVEENP